jgi:hypothetical protein
MITPFKKLVGRLLGWVLSVDFWGKSCWAIAAVCLYRQQIVHDPYYQTQTPFIITCVLIGFFAMAVELRLEQLEKLVASTSEDEIKRLKTLLHPKEH